MRNLVIIISFSLLSTIAFARGGEGSMTGERLSFTALYGLGSVSPGDINNITSNNFSPAIGKISTDTMYSFGLGYRLHPHVELFAYYDMQDAYQRANTTIPSGNSGFELWAQSIWAGADLILIGNERAGLFVGAGAGLPTYLHARENAGNLGNFDFDGNKTVNFMGHVGIDVHVVHRLSIEILGGYQSLTASTLTSTAAGGGVLNTNGSITTNGTAAKFDLSGAFGKAGLKFVF